MKAPQRVVVKQRQRLVGTVSLMTFSFAALLIPTMVKPSTQVVYNGSDSAPRGFYQVQPVTVFHRGDYIVARLPAHVPRNYLVAAG